MVEKRSTESRAHVGMQQRLTEGGRKYPSLQGAQVVQIVRLREEIGQLAPADTAAGELARDRLTHGRRQHPPDRQQAREARQIAERWITSKQLIATEAGERHLHTAGVRRLAHIVGVDAIAGGLIEGVQKAIEVRGHLPAGENGFVMLGAERVRGAARVGGFREGGLLEDDGERLQPRRACARHQGDDGRGIESSREKGAHGHVGDAMRLDSVIESRAQFAVEFLRRAAGARRRAGRREPPPRFHLQPAAGQTGAFTRPQAGHALVDGAWSRHRRVRQIFRHGAHVDAPRHHAGGEQGVEFRGEGEAALRVVVMVIKGFDAERVAGEEKALGRLVPHGKRKHAAQPPQTIFAPARKRGEQHLGVALRVERIAAGGKFGAQFPVIINAAVEDEVIAAAGAGHRLVSARRVDDREAAHAKRRRSTADFAVIVGAAVLHGGAHARHGPTPLFVRVVLTDQTGDATHAEIIESFAGSLPVEATGRGCNFMVLPAANHGRGASPGLSQTLEWTQLLHVTSRF